MDINIILEYFDKLNDQNAMVIEFKNGESLIIDNTDIIRAQDDLIEIKFNFGTYVTSSENVIGLKINNRVDIIKHVIIEKMVQEIGDE